MKKAKVFLGILIVVCIGIVMWWNNGTMAADSHNTSSIPFTVTPGEGLKNIAAALHEKGLIRDPFVFVLMAKLSGADSRIQAGDFTLSPSLTAQGIAESMTKGTQDTWVTIPEGKRAAEVAQILKDKLPSYDPSWDQQLAANEGYLFPDTYQFRKDATIDTILATMKDNFTAKYKEAEQGATTHLSEGDAVVLASILQREGRSLTDMELIASVLENRLAIGMALQTDATIQYALGYQPLQHSWWKKDLTQHDLQITSSYNTYTNPGLPPSPISNPGLDALTAVLHPANTDYLYYISDSKGDLHFAKTLDEQNANIRKYGI